MVLKSDKFTPLMDVIGKQEAMSKDERRAVVLTFLRDHELVLKPNAIYRNLRLHQNITFGEQTVRNILHELVDSGYVRRVDIEAVKKRELVDVEKGSKRGAYMITAKGRQHIGSDSVANLAEN